MRENGPLSAVNLMEFLGTGPTGKFNLRVVIKREIKEEELKGYMHQFTQKTVSPLYL